MLITKMMFTEHGRDHRDFVYLNKFVITDCHRGGV